MDAKQKAKELIYQHLNYTSSWTTISKPTDVSPQAIFEAGMKIGRAKQCAIISMEEVIKYAKTFGDVAEQDISYFNQVIEEIRLFTTT